MSSVSPDFNSLNFSFLLSSSSQNSTQEPFVFDNHTCYLTNDVKITKDFHEKIQKILNTLSQSLNDSDKTNLSNIYTEGNISIRALDKNVYITGAENSPRVIKKLNYNEMRRFVKVLKEVKTSGRVPEDQREQRVKTGIGNFFRNLANKLHRGEIGPSSQSKQVFQPQQEEQSPPTPPSIEYPTVSVPPILISEAQITDETLQEPPTASSAQIPLTLPSESHITDEPAPEAQKLFMFPEDAHIDPDQPDAEAPKLMFPEDAHIDPDQPVAEPTDEELERIKKEEARAELLKQLNPSEIFDDLRRKTIAKNIPYLQKDQVESAFSDVQCPKKGAIDLGENKYLHANKISGEDGYTHIAAQAPQSDVARERFWETALGTNGNLIMDLTTSGDFKNSPKMEGTYPLLGTSSTFGSIRVSCSQSQEGVQGCIISTYQVEKSDIEGNLIESGTVTRISYSNWKDHSGLDVNDFEQLISAIDTFAPQDITPIIHCRAGVGRTGTFITARTLAHLYKQGTLNEENLVEKIKEIILNGRETRGPLFVQVPAQMKLLLDFSKKMLGIS